MMVVQRLERVCIVDSMAGKPASPSKHPRARRDDSITLAESMENRMELEMKSVPANGAASKAMIDAGFGAWEAVMEGSPSQQLGGDALILLLVMTVYRDMLAASE